MAYVANYTADDVAEATISGTTKMVIVFAGFAGIIVLIVLAGWFMKRTKGIVK